MIGINLKLKNEYNNFLHKIFNGININNYDWKIVEDEIIYNDIEGSINTTIFDNKIMCGDDFFRSIQMEKYYLINVNIQAFIVDSPMSDIETYDDFANSTCEIALFCTDTVYIEVYCKNQKVLSEIISNCKKYNFEDLEILTEKTDNRINFGIC